MMCFLFDLVAVFPGRAFTLSTNAAATIVALSTGSQNGGLVRDLG